MKKLFFEFIWQWVGGAWVGFNPIGIELEYDKYEPALGLTMVFMGVGIKIYWIVPWETEESIYARECTEGIISFLTRSTEATDDPNSSN